MISLTVIAYNGDPAQGPSAAFDELGGTIGRADTNQLVLPDPERTISRVHARIVLRAGRYSIVDTGSNPISLNGVQAGAGREQPIKPGDRVQIGGYLLEVQEANAKAASDDPFADLFGDAAGGLATGSVPLAPSPAPRPAPVASPRPAPPAAAPAPRPPAAPPPPAWAPPPAAPMGWGASPPPAPRPAASPAPAAAIPDDWDPFAPVGPDAASPVREQPLADPVLGVPLARRDTLDDLFDLSGATPGADPLGASSASALLQPPNTASDADPLYSLTRTATLMPASHSDHASELNTPMVLGKTTQTPAPAPAAAPASAPAPAPTALPSGAVFSWDEPSSDGRIVTLPGVHRGGGSPPSPTPAPGPAAVVPVAKPQAAAPQPPPRPALVAPPVAPAAVSPPAKPAVATPSAPAVAPDALLAALLEGLGTPGLRLTALTPQTMHLIGEVLRESTRGAVELLVARAALKREMRAEVTMIVARENNPLKFSPTAEVALNHLLGPPAPGFMPPVPAVRDAFDDLRAHQLGVMAGMRAALEGVLKRFDPQQLEGKLTRGSKLSNLIPGARKARLWELFQELFSQLQTEAQDDFDELFGKAFLRAYEEQLDRLHRESNPR